jgi:hypothetical protein
MRVRIDKTRREDLTSTVNRSSGAVVGQVSNALDETAGKGDIAERGTRAGAVSNVHIPN